MQCDSGHLRGRHARRSAPAYRRASDAGALLELRARSGHRTGRPQHADWARRPRTHSRPILGATTGERPATPRATVAEPWLQRVASRTGLISREQVADLLLVAAREWNGKLA